MGQVKKAPVHLVEAQKELLRTLVRLTQKGKIPTQIILIPATTLPSYYVVHIQGEPSLKIKHISDFDALCDAGLLTFHWNRFGNGKFYELTKAGFQAINDDFFQLEDYPNGDVKGLLGEYEQLAQALRKLLPLVLQGQELADGVREWREVMEQVEGPRPDTYLLNIALKNFGQRLISRLDHAPQKPVAKVLILFGEWVEVIGKLP